MSLFSGSEGEEERRELDSMMTDRQGGESSPVVEELSLEEMGDFVGDGVGGVIW